MSLLNAAKTSEKDKEDPTALHKAAESNNVEVAALLLRLGAAIDAVDPGGETALHFAAISNSVDVAELLLHQGAAIEAVNQHGHTALHLAAGKNSVDVAELLLRHGAAIDAVNQYGRTPLYITACGNSVDVAELLLRHGAAIDAFDQDGQTALHLAAQMNNVDVAELLLRHGAAIDAVDPDGETALHFAASENSVDVAELLLRQGAAIDAFDQDGRTALHSAAVHKSTGVAELLLRQGAAIDVVNQNGRTPLHLAAQMISADLAELLLRHGAAIETVDHDGWTPLHLAAQTTGGDVAELLLRHGAAIEAVDPEGQTALHLAAGRNSVDVAELLLRQGAAIEAVNHLGETPLKRFVNSQGKGEDDPESQLKMARLLVECGTSWAVNDREKAAVDKTTDSLVRLVLIQGWIDERERGVQTLSDVPVEVYLRGTDDIRAYFKSVVGAVQHTLYRKKLCVVGQSTWGKTSLIKSLTTDHPTLEEEHQRTMGVDVFSWQFESPSMTESLISDQYNVSVWDFAGQDEYQSMHTLFYSKRTMYVMCINLKAYADALSRHEIHESGMEHPDMDTFVEQNIYHWIRSICAHEPESEFVFVGTKFDLIGHDQATVKKVEEDLIKRIETRESHAVHQLDRAIVKLKADVRSNPTVTREKEDIGSETAMQERKLQSLETLKRKRPRFMSAQLLVTSSSDLFGVASVRQALQKHIVESKTSFPMPKAYLQLGSYIQGIVQQANQATTAKIKSRMDNTFIEVSRLRELIAQEAYFSKLEVSEVTAILNVLHSLGDILWFNETESVLAEMVFLSPEFVIDFVRQVINHDLGETTGEAKVLSQQAKKEHEYVREEGRVTHKLLRHLELWRAVDDDQLMLQLKELLFRFHLAYPDGADGMQWNSDLIVPIYWKKKSKKKVSEAALRNGMQEPEEAHELTTETFPNQVCWEYDFHLHLPESLFEKLAVESSSGLFSRDRAFMDNCFETICESEHHARISKQDVNCDDVKSETMSVLRISVAATSLELAWDLLKWYSSSLEKLLESYPGLWVTRFAVASNGKRIEVIKLVVDQRKMRAIQTQDGLATAASNHAFMALLPPTMDWFIDKMWRDNCTRRASISKTRGTTDMTVILTELHQIKGEIRETKQTVITVAAAVGNRRDYPALWTLDYKKSHLVDTYTLSMRSHLSGKCYHNPIPIRVPSEFFSKYGVVIKLGLSVFSSVVPDFFGKGVVDMVVSAGIDRVDKSMEAHSLVEGLQLSGTQGSQCMDNVRTLSPDETVALLRGLLLLNDPSFDPLRMSELSGLQCGIVRECTEHMEIGEHLWAHRDEILQRSEIQLRHDYVKTPNMPTVSGPNDATPVAELTIPPHRAKQNADEAALPPLDSSTPTPVTASDTQTTTTTMRIVGVDNLRRVSLIGTQSPYCKWRLLGNDGQELASGRTQKHVGGGRNPKWGGQAFEIKLNHKKTLQGCTMFFTVKVTMLINAITQTIADGCFTFHDARSLASSLSTKEPSASSELAEFRVVMTSKNLPAGTLTVQLQH